MRGKPFSLQGKGVLEVEAAARSYWSSSNKGKKGEGLEPRSVLDNRRSPSPPTSTSTLSSSLGGGGGSSDTAGVAALSDANNAHKWSLSGPTNSAGERKEEWASELQPIPATALEMGGEKCGLGVDDWEAMLSESAASPGQEQTFLRWIMGDIDDSAGKQQHLISQAPVEFDSSNSGLGFGGLVDPGFGFDAIGGSSVSAASAVSPPPSLAPPSQPATLLSANKAPSFSNPTNNPIFLQPVPNSLPMFFPEPMEEKPHLFNPGLVLNHHQLAQPPQNPAFFLPLQPDHHLILPPHPKRHHSISADQISPKISFHQSFPQQHPPIPYHLQQRSAKPKDEAAAAAAAAVQQQQAIVDQLFKVAELIEAGNSVSTREILARLNQQLPPSPIGLKPLLRSAFYFKEILHLLSNTPNPTPTPLATPWEVVLKLSAYKAFSEISPLLHFTNFTCTQTLLEELGGFDRIHIIDFDIGIGGQWSSFMQELAHRRSPAIPFLKITAFVSLSSHTLELHLTHDNLFHFAADLNIPFEFTIHSIQSFDPNELLAAVPANEAIAVNLPIGSHYTPSFPSLIRLVKQLSPKIVVSVDQGCDRSDLSFSHHFLHSFQSCLVLLDSIDAVGTNPDVASKIERLLVQPRVESAMMGRHRATDKMHPWRTLFASAGFVPVQFSNFTETQAECLLKRVQVRGFHVEKRQASLFLFWQRGELGSVSAWRC